MNTNFLIIFILLSIVNVIFSTVRSIVTIKGGKVLASIISGGYFSFYNIILLYTVADFPMWQKCIITFICNVVGVFVVKFLEEKTRKDRLWKVELTVPTEMKENVINHLTTLGCPYNYTVDELSQKYVFFNVYSYSKEQSKEIKRLIEKVSNVKYFASESKVL